MRPKKQPGPVNLLPAKARKSPPFPFVLEALVDLTTRTRPMFGCVAVYVGDKIMLALRDRPSSPHDNGLWIATTGEHHASLRRDLPNLRSIQMFGKEVTGWQVLPAEAAGFEEAAMRVCDLIRARDPRIGKVPVRKKTRG